MIRIGLDRRLLRVNVLGALLTALLLVDGGTPDAPVADAAMQGDLETVRSLLKKGADVNASQGDGMTALHWAAVNGDAEMAEVLLYAGANAEATTRVGAHTPLHVAAKEGQADVAGSLVAAGADVMARTRSGATPLHFAAGSGSANVVALLVDAGAEVDAKDTAEGQTALMFGAAWNRVAVLETLLERGADPTITSDVVDIVARAEVDDEDRRRRAKRMAALQAAEDEARAAAAARDPSAELNSEPIPEAEGAAAAEGEEPEAKPSINPAAELNSKAVPAEGEAAGAEAGETGGEGEEAPGKEGEGEAEEGGEGAAGETGAEAQDEEGEEEGEEEAEEEEDGDEPEPLSYEDLVGTHGGLAALHFAAREGHLEAVKTLLAAGADLDQPTAGDHSTPLLVATINGHYDLAMYLIDQEADVMMASEAGATPLYTTLNNRWAPKALYPQPTAWKQQRTSYLELMEALLDAGADPNVRLKKKLWFTSYNFDLLGVDTQGATAFWRAAYATDVEAMRLLVAHGADPDVPTLKPAERQRRGDEEEEEEKEDPSGLPPIPVGGPGVYPIHAASGVGYGQEFAANAHRYVPGGWVPAVKYLVEELGADVNARDHNGYSPVHHAAARGDNELILYLVEQGADVMVVSREGQTTVDMANGPQQRVQPFPETIELLESLGAVNNHNCVSC